MKMSGPLISSRHRDHHFGIDVVRDGCLVISLISSLFLAKYTLPSPSKNIAFLNRNRHFDRKK
jgi:hypothetical protein